MRQQLKRLENCAQRDDSRLTMKSQLIAIVAAVLVVGCGESAPDISIHEAAKDGNIEAWLLDNSVQAGNIQVVEHNIANGADVNAKREGG